MLFHFARPLVAALFASAATATSPYYLMTQVISGDMSHNESWVVPIPVSNSSKDIYHPAILPSSHPQAINRRPGFLANYHQEFSDSSGGLPLGFSLPAVDIKNLTQFGDVYLDIGPAGNFTWNAGFEIDDERGLVFKYAGDRVLSGWVVCDTADYPMLYWTWSLSPVLSDYSLSTCAIVDLVPVPMAGTSV